MVELRSRLRQRLQLVVGLSEREAAQVAHEVLDLFGQTVDEFITTRHTELQREGHSARVCYTQIQSELQDWRYRAEPLSLRQIRRRIYG